MESTFENMISALDGIESYENILKTLHDINKAVAWPRNRENVTVVHTKGYVPHLINNLHHSQKAIIDVSLSIFSSCTMDEHFTREIVEEYDFLTRLDHLLAFYLQEGGIIERIFEILGNICQHRQIWTCSIFNDKPQFVSHALEWLKCFSTDRVFVQRKYSKDTLLMALRFLRLLLHGPPMMCLLVKTFGLLQVLGSFFVDVSLNMKDNEEVLQKIIKVLHDYSPYIFHDSINKTEGGESIMYLCGRMHLFSERVPRIMKNFVKIDQMESPPLLPDICNWIIQKIKDLNIEDSKDDYVSYVCCLCFILLDRCGDHQKKFLPELLKVLEFIKNPSYADLECFILIIMTLNKYCCTDTSLAKDLLDCNMVAAIVEKLMWISGEKTLTLDFKHQGKYENSLKCSKIDRSRHLLGTCNHSNPKFKAKYSGVTSRMSVSSRKYKKEINNFIRCNGGPSSQSDTKSDQSTTERVISDCSCTDKKLIDIMKSTLLGEIVSLIESYICFHPTMPELVSEDLIIALLNCSVYFGRVYLEKNISMNTACKLIQSPSHMLHLIRTSVVEKIYSMLTCQHDLSCATCVTIRTSGCRIFNCFTGVATTERVEREILHGLLTDSDEQKARLVLTIPYIIIKKSLLASFLLKYDGLNVLLDLLVEGSPLKERFIKVLYVLAWHIANPVNVAIAGLSKADKPAPIKTRRETVRVVTFKLDDGSVVHADRNLLSEKSKYFFALLNSSFKESKEEEVALHNVSNDSLQLVLNLLEKPEDIDHLVIESDIDILLNAVVLMDQYVQNELCSLVMECITKYRMKSTVATIYRWSIESGLNLLRAEALTFILWYCFEDDARIAVFNDLGTEFTKELMSDIRSILEGYIRPLMEGS